MNGQRKALIVANDEYEHKGLQRLRSPAADAQALATVLGDRQIGHFDVHTVRNEPHHIIQIQIEDLFSDSQPDDLLLLHFSCHGLKSESGELFFAARNTLPNLLKSTAISSDFVLRCMRDSRSRSIVLLLDCCYGGAFGQGVGVRAGGNVNVLDSFPRERLGGGRARAVIAASSSTEYAFEGDSLADNHTEQPSVFTTALVEGLTTGDADRDEDGWVSLNELYDYVFDRVRAQNPHQTPVRDVEMQGELYIARSRRRRVQPQPIPPGLRAAINEPNMYARLGAVKELRSRLTSDNLPAAAGAYAALTDIVRSDIEHVAKEAEAALRETAVQPDVTELYFGRISQGSAPPRRLIRLLGPPIARACAPHVSDDWIQANEATEGFDISIDTTRLGTLHGSIKLKGTTGEAVVGIDVELIPPRQVTPPPPPTTEPVPPGDSTKAEPSESPDDTCEPTVPDPSGTTMPIDRRWSRWIIPAAYTVVGLALLISAGNNSEEAAGFFVTLLVVIAIVHAFRRHGRAVAPQRISRPPVHLTPHVTIPKQPHIPKSSPGATDHGVDSPIPTFRVVALGVSGSGKTVLLSSMFHMLNVPMPGRSYFLETNASHRVRLSKVFDEVSNTAEPWPEGAVF